MVAVAAGGRSPKSEKSLTWNDSMDDADVTHLLPILLPTDPSLSHKLLIVRMEAEAGIEPANGSFADFCLTTWLLRRS